MRPSKLHLDYEVEWMDNLFVSSAFFPNRKIDYQYQQSACFNTSYLLVLNW